MRAASKRVEARRRPLHPGTWPVRWRLAAVSAGLTLAILLVFGVVIGSVASSRVRDDFSRELKEAVTTLAGQERVSETPFGARITGVDINEFALPNGASVRILTAERELQEQSKGAMDLGPVVPGVQVVGDVRVATTAVYSGATGRLAGYVQYGRSESHIESTIARLWLLIAAGVFLGTLLASFAGVAIAGRAMRPIASLTATAREIAATRDPSRRMPEPAVEDEVGELALTLEEMLRSLDAARTEREDTMKKQREFVADASHELRTPLTSVLANLELLQASLTTAGHAEDREVVDSALRSSKRMSRLVSDLLLLARADAGRLDKHRRCDLAEVAGDAAAEAAPLMGSHTFTVDNDRPLRVEGSPDELHRMVLNLLDNATRHTPAGATIELSLREEDEDAVVEVADDGPGIPAPMRAQIFDRFVRGEGPADTAGGSGTGLGLAIVSAVAASHGGSVEALEAESGGALLRARIPFARSEKTVTDPLKTL
jgi:two-component system, OmpR family, sensor kinase